jgi:poly(A) polymerase/tRNA nucleotidyltransferase (CCA-adding enzyme)
MFSIPAALEELAREFRKHGRQCYLVGGAIRDMLLGRPSTDYDIATDALPQEVQGMFRRVIPTGLKHGTVTVLFRELRIEVTTFRIDREYLDGRRPDSVVFTPSIEEDLRRRDFTVNAIAYDLKSRRLLDPHGGRADLHRGVIRAIGEPLERFHEDGLRPVRACRFAAQFGFSVEPDTFAAIPASLDTVRKVSCERIREELVRLLAAPQPSTGFRLMARCGLLELLLPELAAGAGVEQRSLHCFDVLEHSLRSCDAAEPGNLPVRLAALLHDIGKPAAMRREEDGSLSFHGHERLSAEQASGLMERLRFPTQLIRRTLHLVLHHMFNYTEPWSDAAVRRFIARVGEDRVADLLALRRADQVGTCGDTSPSRALAAFSRRLEKVLEAGRALTLPDLAVDGRDLMQALGLPPGPRIGALLRQLLESVLEDPALNTRETLLAIAGRFYRERLE